MARTSPGSATAPRDRPVTAGPGIAEALHEIHEHPERAWTVQQLSGVAGMSRAAFTRQFRQAVGAAPMAYLTDWRLDTAARLLQETTVPLAAVARRIGYSTPFAFTTAFRRRRPAARSAGAGAGRRRAKGGDGRREAPAQLLAQVRLAGRLRLSSGESGPGAGRAAEFHAAVQAPLLVAFVEAVGVVGQRPAGGVADVPGDQAQGRSWRCSCSCSSWRSSVRSPSRG